MTQQEIRKLRKLDNLIYRFEIFRSFESVEPESPEKINAFMEEIKAQAEKLQQSITDEQNKRKVEYLIQSCKEAMYSHKIYVEYEQFIILETKDAKKKYVMINTDFMRNNHYIDACEYDDAIEHREAVLDNDYLIKIKVSPQIYFKANKLLQEVRDNSGEATTLYGHKEIRTTWTH